MKPPVTAPLATTRVVQRIAEQLPPGVLNVVTGQDANMSALVSQPRDREGLLYGLGERRQEDHGIGLGEPDASHVRVGNDPAVILQDAILDDVHLDRLYAAIYDTTGQICMNAKRVFVTVADG